MNFIGSTVESKLVEQLKKNLEQKDREMAPLLELKRKLDEEQKMMDQINE